MPPLTVVVPVKDMLLPFRVSKAGPTFVRSIAPCNIPLKLPLLAVNTEPIVPAIVPEPLSPATFMLLPLSCRVLLTVRLVLAGTPL